VMTDNLTPSRRPRLAAATVFTRIIRSPDVRSRLTVQGAEVHTMSPAEFGAFFEAERKRRAGVVAQGRIKLE
jgi:tripartite-type tricarboxylate transporter receptor subunit TctC